MQLQFVITISFDEKIDGKWAYAIIIGTSIDSLQSNCFCNYICNYM
jgi:hypothetical protein